MNQVQKIVSPGNTWKGLVASNKPLSLQLGSISLKTMVQEDVEHLVKVANKNKEALKYFLDNPLLPNWYYKALQEYQDGLSVPLAIKFEDKYVGSTRFAGFMSEVPAAEIGWTWLDTAYHGSGINNFMKYLMLRHAFEDWKLVRVQLKTAGKNFKSQRAIEKLGAKKEGILRNSRRILDGGLDDTVMYSITETEWKDVKSSLEKKIQKDELSMKYER